jgi:hypothetical protein
VFDGLKVRKRRWLAKGDKHPGEGASRPPRVVRLVVGLCVLGSLAMPAFNVHTSGGPIVMLAAGAGCALWLSPVYFTIAVALLLRAHRAGLRATRSEAVQTALFALGTVALIALWATST